MLKKVLSMLVYLIGFALLFVFGMGMGSIFPEYRPIYSDLCLCLTVSLISIAIGFFLGKKDK